MNEPKPPASHPDTSDAIPTDPKSAKDGKTANAPIDPEKIRPIDVAINLSYKQVYGLLGGFASFVAAIFLAGYGLANITAESRISGAQSEIKGKEAELEAKRIQVTMKEAQLAPQEAALTKRESELKTQEEASRKKVEEANKIKAGFDMARFIFQRGCVEDAFRSWRDASAAISGPIPASGKERSDRLDLERNLKQRRMDLDQEIGILTRLIHKLAIANQVNLTFNEDGSKIVEITFVREFEEVAGGVHGKFRPESRVSWKVPDGIAIASPPS